MSTNPPITQEQLDAMAHKAYAEAMDLVRRDERQRVLAELTSESVVDHATEAAFYDRHPGHEGGDWFALTRAEQDTWSGNIEAALAKAAAVLGSEEQDAASSSKEEGEAVELLRRVAGSGDGWANGMDPDLFDEIETYFARIVCDCGHQRDRHLYTRSDDRCRVDGCECADFSPASSVSQQGTEERELRELREAFADLMRHHTRAAHALHGDDKPNYPENECWATGRRAGEALKRFDALLASVPSQQEDDDASS